MLTTLKAAVKGMARYSGYQIVRLPAPIARTNERALYETVTPRADYAPWNSDELFLSTFESVRRDTKVDVYRCWELWTLVEQSSKLGGNIIEIGVWRGGTGALLANKAALCGIDATVYLCDTFRGVVKAGIHDTIYKGGELATPRQSVDALVQRFGLDYVQILEGVFPDDTASLIDESRARFRLCHVDVDVYQSAKDILDWIWGRMVAGGVMVYDDYGFNGCQGITKLVNEQKGQEDRLIIHNLNGHALVVKL